MHNPSKPADVDRHSPVSRLFAGRSVFITGASGFIGRVLLEKLLRTYQDINKVYLLMRPKKQMQPSERLHKQLLKVPIFDKIKSMSNGQQLLDKIVLISGDISEPQLGISQQDMDLMLNDPTLSVVFHSAATIKFDEPLRVSVKLNLQATRTMIEFCKNLPNLVSLCHVSTAYVNADRPGDEFIEEKLYPIKEKPEKLIAMADLLDENLMQKLKLELVAKRPNTYTYTKALAEHLITEEAKDLPVCIVRPSIVVAAWREPIPGWIDNLNGPTGLILAIGKGLLRTMHVIRKVKADVIPVDIVVNTMIASTYYTAKIYDKLPEQVQNSVKGGLNSISDSSVTTTTISTTLSSSTTTATTTNNNNNNNNSNNNNYNNVNNHRDHNQEQQETNKSLLSKQQEETSSSSSSLSNATNRHELNTPPIIHCNSSDINPITWGRMEDLFMPIIRNYPSAQVLRYPFGSFKGNRYHDLVMRLFVHFLPAMLIDLLCLVLGKKRQLLFIYGKLHMATKALSHFCIHNYNFRSRNIKLVQKSLEDERDKRDLYMDISSLDWLAFWDSYVLGARRFVLKEEDHTLESSRKSFKRALYAEYMFRALLALVAIICVIYVSNKWVVSSQSIVPCLWRSIKV